MHACVCVRACVRADSRLAVGRLPGARGVRGTGLRVDELLPQRHELDVPGVLDEDGGVELLGPVDGLGASRPVGSRERLVGPPQQQLEVDVELAPDAVDQPDVVDLEPNLHHHLVRRVALEARLPPCPLPTRARFHRRAGAAGLEQTRVAGRHTRLRQLTCRSTPPRAACTRTARPHERGAGVPLLVPWPRRRRAWAARPRWTSYWSHPWQRTGGAYLFPQRTGGATCARGSWLSSRKGG